ncbi:MAG: CpXC domain-containing protein [Verrucomicrobiota bacterium]
MALKATYDIRCSCGAAFSADVYEYVFAEHDPELKDAILSGDFNRVPCPACGQLLAVESQYLYRDETNRLWVWVCAKGEEAKKDGVDVEGIEKKTLMDFHFLDHQEAYRKHVVFGRDGLLELLWSEDPALGKAERKALKENAAYWAAVAGNGEPAFLLLSGRRIRLSLPLRCPEAPAPGLKTREGKGRWLRAYAQGLNLHNRYSSFLDARSRARWSRIREKEPMGGTGDEFADFAESWARLKLDARAFSARCPQRRAFLEGLKGLKVSRKLRCLDRGREARKPGRSR